MRVNHPGVTLLAMLKENGMTQSMLAEYLGRPRKTINQIIKGKAQITCETALQLEWVFGTPAETWMVLEAMYRLDILRAKTRGSK